MYPILIAIAVGLVVGLIRGGSFAILGRAHLRVAPLVFVGLAIQLGALFFRRPWSVALTLVAFMVVLVFSLANVRQPGMGLIALGALMNVSVLLANGGMPLRHEAVVQASLPDPFAPGGPTASVHEPYDEHTRLKFLADIIPLPPVHRVVSPGDTVLWAGLLLVVQSLTVGPRGRRRAGAVRADLPEPDNSH